MNKKQIQLGMNPSTASQRLLKDLLFNFVILGGYKCHKCKGKLTRETFSVEHIEPWLDSENPVKLFFAIENIAYSHLICNVSAARRIRAEHGTRPRYTSGCKCQPCRDAEATYKRDNYTREKRREKYLKHNY